MRILWGILIGILICLTLLFGYRKVINPYYTMSIPKFITDTSKKPIISESEINGLKTQLLSSEEKISYYNKRIDDILIFGGIIVTLLLVINVAVYTNGEKQVTKYLEDNVGSFRDRAQDLLGQIQETASSVNTEWELMQSKKEEAENVQPPNS